MVVRLQYSCLIVIIVTHYYFNLLYPLWYCCITTLPSHSFSLFSKSHPWRNHNSVTFHFSLAQNFSTHSTLTEPTVKTHPNTLIISLIMSQERCNTLYHNHAIGLSNHNTLINLMSLSSLLWRAAHRHHNHSSHSASHFSSSFSRMRCQSMKRLEEKEIMRISNKKRNWLFVFWVLSFSSCDGSINQLKSGLGTCHSLIYSGNRVIINLLVSL